MKKKIKEVLRKDCWFYDKDGFIIFDEGRLIELISTLLSQQKQDHEILVNTIIDTKNGELKQQKQELRKKILKLKKEEESWLVCRWGYKEAIDDILKLL